MKRSFFSLLPHPKLCLTEILCLPSFPTDTQKCCFDFLFQLFCFFISCGSICACTLVRFAEKISASCESDNDSRHQVANASIHALSPSHFLSLVHTASSTLCTGRTVTAALLLAAHPPLLAAPPKKSPLTFLFCLLLPHCL